MTTEELVFDSTVEGVFSHGLADRVTPELKERLREAGVNLDRKLLPGYPRAVWTRCLEVIADVAFPGMSRDEALAELGVRSISGYERTIIGRAMLSTVRLFGPRRLLERFDRNLRTTCNYLRSELRELGPSDFELKVTGWDVSPHYMRGGLQRSLEYAGAKNVHSVVERLEGPAVVYRFRWS